MIPERATRREVVSLTGMALVSLAGCARSGAEQGSPSPTAGEPTYSQSVDAPEAVTVRNHTGTAAVRSSAHTPGEDLFESSAAWDYEDWLVTAPKERDRLYFSQAVTGVETARGFLTETDLSESTLLVHQYNIGLCETRRPTRLKWGKDFSCGDTTCTGIHLNYEETGHGGDCQQSASKESNGPPYPEESHASEATVIRIPAQIQSYGRFSTQG